MKKPIAILLCLVMVMSMLSACGSSGSTAAPADSGTSGAAPAQSGSAASDPASAQGPEIVYVDADDSVYRVLYSSEVTTLNYLTSSNTNDQRIGANTVDTLVEYDSNGEIQPSLATEWTYDDEAQTWTFKLREGQKWVDTTGAPVADVTAGDFVAAMKYMLTPEMGSTTAQNLFGVILNAEEYYNGLAGEEDYKPIDFSEVGVRAEDDYTLVYTLETPVPYFLSMLTYVCFMPAYGPQLEELGASFATSADTMYYNGAYYVSAFEPQVQLVYTKNALNWDAEHIYIETIQRTYNAEASTIGPEMVRRGEIDSATLSSDIVDAWMADPATAPMVSMERPSLDTSYYYCFNFNVHALNENFYRDGMTGWSIDEKYEPWNWEIAVNNENFRQSIRYAINRLSTMYVATGDAISPDTFLENTITPKGFAVDPVTGKDFTAQSAISEIASFDNFDPDMALMFKELAMEELSAQGVTFPVKVLVRYNPSTTNWDNQCVVLEQQLESVLGADYIDVIVEAGPSENFLSLVRRSCDYMLLLCNWVADYADPETWTDPFYQSRNEDGSYHRGFRYAYMAYAITDGTDSADTVAEYFRLVEEAKKITDDTDKRYAAFAAAESYLIEHALVVPYGTQVPNFVVTRINPWEGQYAAFGISNQRFKGMKLLDHYLTMQEYNNSAISH
ncbi:MAG: peptide ABC transporter substrate-binding protein [Oscillospiraceae bacterium]|nr:peptide ABC transporter substrate-binding protein [Oscillospiraceae bacterium]